MLHGTPRTQRVSQVSPIDEPTRLIPLPRNAGIEQATSLLERVLDAGFDATPDVPPVRRASYRGERRARSKSRARMAAAARQFGKPYYVPRSTRRAWLVVFFGLSFMVGSLEFFMYVMVCRWLDLIP